MITMALIGFSFSESSLEFLESIPNKLRVQIIKKAKALLKDHFPQGCKKLHGVTTPRGEPVYRERSGDYRILYVVRTNPEEVVILDIDHRKDVYR